MATTLNDVTIEGNTITPSLQPQLSLKLEPKGWLVLLEKLLDLKNAGLLKIDNDFEKGMLTIISKVSSSNDNATTIDRYLAVLNAEFTLLKNQLQTQKIDVSNYTQASSNNQTVFRIPSGKHYDQFIEQLKNQELLSFLAKKEQVVAAEEDNLNFELSPFSMVPVPKGGRHKKK
ncbi:hypothetical protein [Legionella hackeliae]|uniref:Uncharacterized protein n=1 Tax=Legionella hackeliae TaxID=449 RepID=A0A0A8UW02_LEGHA|nr:hypothetical protein [Legionella hackeliae]KTD10011.1 hypothetical protein Lhac_2379 [Legionella hackeliae]CEK11686.1 protein of unknown function [Legionella hackeliae]STX48455.1 Uncharacterised protein [Legionella hackeliae]